MPRITARGALPGPPAAGHTASGSAVPSAATYWLFSIAGARTALPAGRTVGAQADAVASTQTVASSRPNIETRPIALVSLALGRTDRLEMVAAALGRERQEQLAILLGVRLYPRPVLDQAVVQGAGRTRRQVSASGSKWISPLLAVAHLPVPRLQSKRTLTWPWASKASVYFALSSGTTLWPLLSTNLTSCQEPTSTCVAYSGIVWAWACVVAMNTMDASAATNFHIITISPSDCRQPLPRQSVHLCATEGRTQRFHDMAKPGSW